MLSEFELERMRRAVKLRAYSTRPSPDSLAKVMVGRPRAEDDVQLLLDEIDRLRSMVGTERAVA